MKYKILEHARMRYSTMTQRERFLRVGKMAQMEKLEAFLFVARENKNVMLEDLVKARMQQLRDFDTGVVESASGSSSSSSSTVARRVDQAKVERRSPKAKDDKGAEVVIELERDIVL